VSSIRETPYALRLTWSKLPKEKSNGPITGYALYWRQSAMEPGPMERLEAPRELYMFSRVSPNEQ